ncbi:MAG: hypothetical protein ACK4N5_21395 [Myxococcales bacterium]
MPLTRLSLACLVLLCGCPSSVEPPPAAPPDAAAPPDKESCRTFAPPRQVGTVSDPALGELSGIVASRSQPGVYFVHNDSGDAARFFAIDASGALLAEYRLDGVTAVDFEDIDLGPCPSGTCLFIGDVGDNLRRRGEVVIYRVPEPTVERGAKARTLQADALRFTYPDGAHDVEALFAHPRTGELFVVTKHPDTVAVYAVSQTGGDVQQARRIASFKPPEEGVLFTAGNLHPDGARLLLRAYGALFELRGSSEDVAALFNSPFRALTPPDELQGEAIAWLADGTGWISVAEGAGAVLFRADCR